MLPIPHNKLPWLNDVNLANTWHHKRHSIPNEFEGAVPTRFQCPYPNCRLFCVGNIGIGLWPPNILWPKILIKWVFFHFSWTIKFILSSCFFMFTVKYSQKFPRKLFNLAINSLLQCTLDLLTHLVCQKIVTKSRGVTK